MLSEVIQRRAEAMNEWETRKSLRDEILIRQSIALLESGVPMLISDICEGRVIELDPIQNESIANWARANESTCKAVFDLSVQGMSDLAIVHFFLQWSISSLTAKIFMAGQTAMDEDVENRERLLEAIAL